jgi:hypothetical protein
VASPLKPSPLPLATGTKLTSLKKTKPGLDMLFSTIEKAITFNCAPVALFIQPKTTVAKE